MKKWLKLAAVAVALTMFVSAAAEAQGGGAAGGAAGGARGQGGRGGGGLAARITAVTDRGSTAQSPDIWLSDDKATVMGTLIA